MEFMLGIDWQVWLLGPSKALSDKKLDLRPLADLDLNV